MAKTVTLSFTGLMLFHFNRHLTECRVGFHTKTPEHSVTVKVGTNPLRRYSTDELRQFKHLWLYVADTDQSLDVSAASPPVSKRKSGDDTDFSHVVNLETFYGGRHFNPNWEEYFTPSLHLPGGEFYTETLSDYCRRVEHRMLEYLYYPIFQANADNVLEKFEQAKRLYEQYGKLKIATHVGVNIAVEEGKWLVLALGNETQPQYILTSRQVQEDLNIKITNLPDGGSDVLGRPRHRHLELLEEQDVHSANQPEAHSHDTHADTEHQGQQRTHDVGMQIRQQLPQLFHFLHYYFAFDFRADDPRYVLLEHQTSLEPDASAKGPKPEPPCNCITCDEP